MAGGSGTRLWPLSRAQFPKQFLALTGARSLFQQATSRLMDVAQEGVVAVSAPCIVGNEDHRFMIQEQLRAMSLAKAEIILEPAGRNTAPALTLAALHATADGGDPVLVVAPADQTVTHPEAFSTALRSAVHQAAEGCVVILGIKPAAPETGYGYIRTGKPGDDRQVCTVEAFVEKPDLPTAQRYVGEGNYFWNSGIFVLRASVWLAALQTFRPDIRSATEAAWSARQHDGNFTRPGREPFLAIPSESVDYAVMERCPGSVFPIRMVPLDAGWSDLGAWDAVWQVSGKDADGNAATGDAILHSSRNALVHATHRLVSVVGLEDVVVVETADAVLVTHRKMSQDVKKVVSTLHAQDRYEQNLHRQVNRPWGWYDSIDSGERFQVKRIMVKPGASLSLQMHHHRAEHWIVVSGTAEVTVGDKVTLLSENQSTYIPLGQTHRLRNPGKLPLELIEVQSGSYLGEDDIVRFEDHYGRS
jgi:mannose-1-phosphate guanylyltransferase/mannose-6-phosphate isomerase